MATKKQINEAVAALAAEDDGSWTASGLPSVAAVSTAIGEQVTREEISAASDRMRDNPTGAAAVYDPSKTGAGYENTKTDPDNIDGPEPEAIFKMLDDVVAAAYSPRWRRNQVLQQVARLWQNEQATARKSQDGIEGRVARRIEKREEKAQRETENA